MNNFDEIIRPMKSPKAYLLIVAKIVSLVANGELSYGEHLYTEKDLMNMLGVSRPTLREALRVLEFLGVVTVSPRKGIAIQQPDISNGYMSLIFILMFDKTTNIEIFQLRRAIQTEMVAAAATVGSTEELKRLTAIVDEMESKLDVDYITFEKLDYDFHMQIVVCAHNMLCLKLMQTLGKMIHSQMKERLSRMPVEDRCKTLSFHKQILNAILQRDSIKAKRLMEEHLADVFTHLETNPVQFNINDLLNR